MRRIRLLPAGAFAGWDLHPLKSAALSRRTRQADIADRDGGRCSLGIADLWISHSRRASGVKRAIGPTACQTTAPKMLIQQLRSLERDGVVSRVLYPVVPPKVEYSLTMIAESRRQGAKAAQDCAEPRF